MNTTLNEKTVVYKLNILLFIIYSTFIINLIFNKIIIIDNIPNITAHLYAIFNPPNPFGAESKLIVIKIPITAKII